MATLSPVLRATKTNKSGTAPIYIRISDTDGHRFLSLGVRVRPRQWNPSSGRVRRSHPEEEELNALISDRLAQGEREALRLKVAGERVTADAIKRALDTSREEVPDFLAYADRWAEGLRRGEQINYYRRARAVLGKLKSFAGPHLPLDEFTADVLAGFCDHLRDNLGNSQNTVVVNLTLIRTVVRRAIREGVMSPADDPFVRFTRPRQTRTKRSRPSLDDIRALAALYLPAGSFEDVVRDTFLFSFFCAGIRFGDVCRLTWVSVRPDGQTVRLDYQMSKTGARKSLQIVPPALDILAKYRPASGDVDPNKRVFPLLDGYDLSTPESLVRATSSRNARVNGMLKELARQAGIQTRLNFHGARHAFSEAARRAGTDVFKISQALGHSSLKVTTAYLAGFDGTAADEAVSDVMRTLY